MPGTMHHLDRYYSLETTPSPQSVPPQHVVSGYYPELEDDAFHSDEEIQKVRVGLCSLQVCARPHSFPMERRQRGMSNIYGATMSTIVITCVHDIIPLEFDN